MSTQQAPAKKYLVTGATGKIGGGAAEILRDAGADVRLLVRDPEKARAFRDRGFEVVEGSYEESARVTAACEGVDSILLVPTDANPTAANSVVDAAVASGVRRVVRISAVGSHADAHGVLLRNHAAGELHLESSGLEFQHLRCNSFLQNLTWYSEWVERLGVIYACHGERPMSWIDARDVAAGAAAALLASSANAASSLELNGPQALTGFDIAEHLGASVGRTIKCVSLEGPAFVEEVMAHGWSEGLATEWATQFTHDYRDERLADGSDSDFRTLTGRSPRSIDAFLKDNPIQAAMTPFSL